MPSPRRRADGSSHTPMNPVRRVMVQLTVLALLPLWPFIGYPLQRNRRMRPRSIFLRRVASHPVVIALSAPMRFLAGRPFFHRLRRGRAEGPPEGGVREPRRPRTGPPQDAIALPEPRD
jgi:hypothetical protein